MIFLSCFFNALIVAVGVLNRSISQICTLSGASLVLVSTDPDRIIWKREATFGCQSPFDISLPCSEDPCAPGNMAGFGSGDGFGSGFGDGLGTTGFGSGTTGTEAEEPLEGFGTIIESPEGTGAVPFGEAGVATDGTGAIESAAVASDKGTGAFETVG